MIKAILLDKDVDVFSTFKDYENNSVQRFYKYFTEKTVEELSKQVNINNLDLILMSSPVENFKKFPEKNKNIETIKKGDLLLFSDPDENMSPLLVMVWEVMKDSNTFYGFPVIENIDLATKSSVIFENNTGLPIGWDFVVLFEFGEEYDFSIIDENGYFGMIQSSFDFLNIKKGHSLIENFDLREYELISIQNLTKFYASLESNIVRTEISPNNVMKEDIQEIRELNLSNQVEKN